MSLRKIRMLSIFKIQTMTLILIPILGLKLRNYQPSNSKAQVESGQKISSQPTIVLCGDSMIKNVQGWCLSKEARTITKSYPGATIDDLFDHIQPTLCKMPDEIIVHAGTNDLKNKEESVRTIA